MEKKEAMTVSRMRRDKIISQKRKKMEMKKEKNKRKRNHNGSQDVFEDSVYFVPLRSSRSPTFLIVFNYFRGWRGRVAGGHVKR